MLIGSTPDKIGWNVPPSNNKPTSTNVKASAPVSEHAGKTSATNVQSGYNPSGIPYNICLLLYIFSV